MFQFRSCLVVCLLLPFLSACAASPMLAGETGTDPTPVTIQTSIQPVQIPKPSETPFPTAMPSPTQPPAPTSLPVLQVCSPLRDISPAQINEMISNPFLPPPPGSDDPHQGVDLADRLPGSQVAISGREVQAVLPGQVAAVIQNRFPYGNAILVETHLEAYPASAWETVPIPTAAPTLAHTSPLTCPTAPEAAYPDPARRSLYLLYAHLDQPPGLQPDEPVTCGQSIGNVGGSGNAINPHLHVEVRVGPSGLRLASMAHYDASASADEMRTYCLWRISGLFQLVDPLQILLYQPPR